MSLVVRLAVAALVAVLLLVGLLVTARLSPAPRMLAGPPGCCIVITPRPGG